MENQELNENILTRDEMLRSARWYKMRFVSLILCVMAAMTFGCDKDDAIEPPSDPITSVTPPTQEEPEKPDTPTEPTIPQDQKHNVELEFNANLTTNLHFDTINKYVNDKYVDSIYLVLNKGSTFSGYPQANITNYRNAMQKRTDLSPRIRGRGDFFFYTGEVLPDDSLYFVSKGWTVNNRFNKQY